MHDNLCNDFNDGALQRVNISNKIATLKCSWIQSSHGIYDQRQSVIQSCSKKVVLKICIKFRGGQPCRSVVSNSTEITLDHVCSPITSQPCRSVVSNSTEITLDHVCSPVTSLHFQNTFL